MNKEINPAVLIGVISLVVLILVVVGYKALAPRHDGPTREEMARAMGGGAQRPQAPTSQRPQAPTSQQPGR